MYNENTILFIERNSFEEKNILALICNNLIHIIWCIQAQLMTFKVNCTRIGEITFYKIWF